MKNYYQILNVKQTATESEIKSSYRVLAKRYHPDVNPGDETAASKFADINEANAVLSDPKQRAEYDQKLMEAASANRANPEDVMARQRAQAQAAARQAAARQAAYQGMNHNDIRRDAASMARARAAAQARAQAAAQMAAQAQAQAQVQALRNQAYQAGREQGAQEARAAAEAEISRLNANLRNVTNENKTLKKQVDELTALHRQLDETENDRRELEQELFHRDREVSTEKLRIKELEDRIAELESGGSSTAKRLKAENAELNDKLSAAQKAAKKTEQETAALVAEKDKLEQEVTRLRQETKQAELKNSAQIQLQQDKRKQMQEEIDELRRQIDALNTEMESLREENEQWQQYAKSEEFLSDTERRMQEWSKKTNADRRLAKPTIYADLGVLIWASDEEIKEAYTKLHKRYSGKTDEAIVAKLEKIEVAYTILSDPERRAEYNATINITDERIADERRMIAENESLMEEYRNRLADKEFWARYDEITASAMAGDANAQNTLGEMLYSGEDVDRDVEQAAYWFKEAAKQTHADAMYHLGVCYLNGEGVEKNETTGNGFIRQAAKLGSKAAKLAVGKK